MSRPRIWPPARKASAVPLDRRIDAIRRQLVGAFDAGADVGEVLVLAACAAQQQLDKRGECEALTDNRSGSWEAAILAQALQSGGAL